MVEPTNVFNLFLEMLCWIAMILRRRAAATRADGLFFLVALCVPSSGE